MKRHIIVEGMDGSGKDTLIDKLMLHPAMRDHTRHTRASTSLGGPVQNLAQWTIDDVAAMPTNSPKVYNRHPLISEPIYAPHRRVNPGLRGAWRDRTWVHLNRLIAAEHCLVILCHPAFSTVHANLMRSPHGHMPGVVEHASKLYDSYTQLVWPGRVIHYNYRRDSFYGLLAIVNRMIEKKESSK